MAGGITNPDFAEPGIGAGQKQKLFTTKNRDGIPGWEVTQDAVQLVALAPGARPDGAGSGQALRLKGDQRHQAGSVSLTVPTTPGRKTTISWMESPDLSGQAGSDDREQEYTVLIRPVETANGPGRMEEVFTPAGTAGPDWCRRSVGFTPASTSATVEFSAALQGALAPLITGLALTAGAGRQQQPPALYGTVTGSPVRAEPGETIPLTFTVGNRATRPAPGEKAGVAFRPQPPLAPAAGSPGTLTFPGRQLVAGRTPEQGVFKVTVPPGSAPGTYRAVAVLSYDGAPVADGTLTWQVEVVAERARTGMDETGLVVFQVTGEPRQPPTPYLMFMADAPRWPTARASARPAQDGQDGQAERDGQDAQDGQNGQDSLLCIGIASLAADGDIVALPQRIKAPSGFVFTGDASFGHFRTVRSWAAVSPKVELTLRLSEGDTLATITGSGSGEIPVHHLDPTRFADPGNALSDEQTVLGYGFGLAAAPDARPGLHEDGWASFGRKLRIPLIGRIL